jgi:hypothetical protein
MPTLDDVYLKFGFAAEAAQLIETELGTLLMMVRGGAAGLLETPDPERAADMLESINRQTLGQLLKSMNNHTQSLDALEDLLRRALEQRNRLFHTFYREHNFRRNSEEGRALMLEDLEAIHSALLDAYKPLMALSGVDLENLPDEVPMPTRHLPI